MKIIIGLGNPGEEFKNTKHNIGFQIIDLICKEYDITLNLNKFGGVYFLGEDVIIAKPLTFMNKSGFFVKEIINFYKINIEDILIIYDDLDSNIGQAKIKISGSSGGHNGMKSIIEQLGTCEIKRLKIGIGRPKDSKIISQYVLSNIPKKHIIILSQVIKQSAQAAMSFIYNDIRLVVNSFNVKKK